MIRESGDAHERSAADRDVHDSDDHVVRAYRYDALDRLIGVREDSGTTTFDYDAAGNRTGVRGSDATFAFFDSADQLTRTSRSSAPGGATLESFSYDANGNLLSRQRAAGANTTYRYDAADHLVGLTDGPPASRRTLAFGYDGDGNLYRDGALTNTLDLARPLTEVLAATNGTVQADYLYGLGRISAVGTSPRTYVSDVRGSVRALTNSAGRVVDTQSVHFGNS